MSPAKDVSAQMRPRVILCWSLLALQLLLLGVVLFHWGRGEPELYPGQHASRAFTATTSLGLVGALLIAQTPSYRTFRGRLGFWLFLGGAMVALTVRMIIGL
jgi:hypothetical protein